MEHSFKELPILHIFIKNQNGQIIRHLPQTHRHPRIPPFQKSSTPKLHKSHPLYPRTRIYTIVSNKNLLQTRREELRVTLQQRLLPDNTSKQGIWISWKKIPLKELQIQKRTCNENPLAYVSTYNKNNEELFTEIRKNLEQFKNNDKTKKIRDTRKIIWGFPRGVRVKALNCRIVVMSSKSSRAITALSDKYPWERYEPLSSQLWG